MFNWLFKKKKVEKPVIKEVEELVLKNKCKCGRAIEDEEIEIYGHKMFIKASMGEYGSGEQKLCAKCLAKRDMLLCPWCNELIRPGEYITLYSPTDKKFKIKDGVMVYDEESRTLVGCQRWDCAHTGADYTGILHQNKEIKRFKSGIQRIMEGEGVVIQNFD